MRLTVGVLVGMMALGVPDGIVEHASGVGNKVDQDRGLSLAGATYIGGSAVDDAYEPSVEVADELGIFVSGFTASTDFPVTAAAYDTMYTGGRADRFVSRFEPGLATLTASTYVGSAGTTVGFIAGSGTDLGHAVAVDDDGNVYIAGYTESPDYPITEDGFDTEYNGGRDVFVSKFDSDLSTLLASTFLGGTGDEGYRWPRIDMTITESGDVAVVGITHSVDFPVTAGAFSRQFSGGSESGDAFVAVLDSDLSELRASTYLGGSHNEWRVAVHALDDGGVLLCGETESSDFPTSTNAYSRTLNVIKDVFVARFDRDLTTLGASTLFGGSSLDEALDLAVSTNDEVYIAGYTESEDLPVTSGSYSQSWAGGRRDGYVAKFDADLSTLISSTFVGGSAVDFPRGIVLDSRGNVLITGNTTSDDFPTTDSVVSGGFRGGTSRGDVFLTVFDTDLSAIDYSTLIGGSGEDTGFGIDITANGGIVVVGSTSSADFPMRPNSYDDTYNGGPNDSFVLEFSRR